MLAMPPVADLLLPTGWICRDELMDRSQGRAIELRQQGLAPGDMLVCAVDGATAELSIMQGALALNQAALVPCADAGENSAVRALAAHTGASWWWEAGRLIATDVKQTASLNQAASRLAASDQTVSAASPMALVIQTSGSSGGRKAAMLSAAALQASCERINARLDLRPSDLWLCALPRQHIGGLAIGYRCALAGAGVLLHQGFAAERVAADLWQHPVTHLSLVPAMLARLMAACPRPPDWLRVVLLGGQALDAGLAQQALAAGWPLHLGYGMTETCSFIASRALTAADSMDAEMALTPLPDVQLQAPDCMAPPPSAALRLTGPMLMSGYANPERRLGLGLDAQGWLRSGDLACLSKGPGLHIIGRADDQLVIAGVNVQPQTIAAQLSECAGVTHCTLVGLPEPVWGHTLVALYQGIAPAEQLDAWCRSQLPSAQRPRLFVRLDDWPLLTSGKEDRRRLRQLAETAWDENLKFRGNIHASQ